MSTEPNTQTPIDPTTWHRKPATVCKGAKCPVCGFPRRTRVEHRAIAADEGLLAKWFYRSKSSTGWQVFPVLVRSRTRGRRPGPMGPTRKTLTFIQRATSMIAAGKTARETAADLGVPEYRLDWTRGRYPGLWEKALESAIRSLAVVLRSKPGTDAALEDPDAHCRSMTLLSKWSDNEETAEEKPMEDWTLCDFFELYYRPRCLYDASAATVGNYRSILRRWKHLTGDPPLEKITAAVLLKFREALGRSRGLKRGSTMTSNTIHDILRRLQTLLDKSGPPGRRNRDAVGIVKEPAWIRPPRQISRMPRTAAVEHVEAVYREAGQMTFPVFPGIPAPAWWRALIVVAFNTGIRRKVFFDLRMDWIHWDRRFILIPGEVMKSDCDHVSHLNRMSLDCLQSIRTDRELIFPWPLCGRQFDKHFHRLQNRAGIPPEEHFGLQNLRRSLGTNLWSHSPQASQLALGHAGSAVTMKYYIQGEGIVAEALDALPQPAAFSEGLGSPAAPLALSEEKGIPSDSI